MPRQRNPETGVLLLETAARLLADEGPLAITARRLAAEIGTSTMAVYTHFGGMDELFVAVWRLGFTRFGAALAGPDITGDPVADWIAQGWAYRRFAHENEHLYRVMFDNSNVASRAASRADQEAAMATFASLLQRLQRCVDAGRFDVEDLQLAGEVVWSTVHGHMSIEMTGYFRDTGRDAHAVYAEGMRRVALSFGDDPTALARSMEVGLRRARSAATDPIAQRSISERPSAQAISTC